MTHVTLPAEREVRAAVEGQRTLAAFLSTKSDTQQIEIVGEDQSTHRVELPTMALRLLADILAELATGNAVKVVPVHAELTTQEAADMLNVSRPHLVKLLDDGVIAHHKTGKHRRIRFADLMAYKNRREEERRKALEELTQLGQDMGI